MKLRAVRNSDGSIDVDGARYRLEESGERFVVVRADDGSQVGAFRMTDAMHGFEVDASDETRAIVRAVAKLLSTPRGLLPLQ